MLRELCIYGATVHFNGTTTFIEKGGPGIEVLWFSILYFVGSTTFNKFFTNEIK